MATGDQSDMLARLKSNVPPWFGNSTTAVLDAAMTGFASVAAAIYALIVYVTAQTRIATASDGFLDMIALDFFGRRIQRFPGETDGAFQTRIKAELFRPRNTRAAMIKMLEDLTGQTPLISEPSWDSGAGGWGIMTGYAVAGAYGSSAFPGEVFITAFRLPANTGVASVNGYSGLLGGYGIGLSAYVQPAELPGVATDADILAAIDATKPCGIIAHTNIQTSFSTARLSLMTENGHLLCTENGFVIVT